MYIQQWLLIVSSLCWFRLGSIQLGTILVCAYFTWLPTTLTKSGQLTEDMMQRGSSSHTSMCIAELSQAHDQLYDSNQQAGLNCSPTVLCPVWPLHDQSWSQPRFPKVR